MNPTCSRRLPDETLHRLFDGDLVDAALSAHVAACPACSDRLRRLREQQQLLGTLFAPSEGGDADLSARLGALLGQHARESLADLVFELAESCLDRARRLRKLPAPREAHDLLPEISSVAARLAGLGDPVDLGELQSQAGPAAAHDSDLSGLLTACVHLLAALEGSSDRVEALSDETAGSA